MLLLAFCFVAEDVTLLFVAENLTDEDGIFGALMKISGVWSGRQGSFLALALATSAFAALVGGGVGKRDGRSEEDADLDAVALLVMCLVLIALTGYCCFAPDGGPFALTPSYLLNSDSTLSAYALAVGLGLGDALEHWALACHPPLLFAGYAGMTVPFAYAVAAVATGDVSGRWARRARPFGLCALAFLAGGVLLGSVWAADGSGWGTWWSWDPIENVGLLPVLSCVAFLHAAALYDRDPAFARQALLFAACCFASVLFGIFVARSGYIDSVHSYAGETPAMLVLPALAMLCVAGVIGGMAAHRGSFSGDAEGLSGLLPSAMFIGGVMTALFCAVLCYATCAPSLPGKMPFGGEATTRGVYDTMAALVGMIVLASMAVFALRHLGRCDLGLASGRARRTFVMIHVAAAVVIAAFVANCLTLFDPLVYVIWLGGLAFVLGSLLRVKATRRSARFDGR